MKKVNLLGVGEYVKFSLYNDCDTPNNRAKISRMLETDYHTDVAINGVLSFYFGLNLRFLDTCLNVTIYNTETDERVSSYTLDEILNNITD